MNNLLGTIHLLLSIFLFSKLFSFRLLQCKDQNKFRALVAGLARVSLLWHQLNMSAEEDGDMVRIHIRKNSSLPGGLPCSILYVDCVGVWVTHEMLRILTFSGKRKKRMKYRNINSFLLNWTRVSPQHFLVPIILTFPTLWEDLPTVFLSWW